MPRTASSETQPRSNAKARPSANVRAGNLVANTPVLFRLPAIPTAPAQDLSVTFSEAAASLPTATLAAVALSIAQPAAMPTEQTSDVSVTPHAAPQQTWWEHWSSGIVLIVLLIALATASILAWQGSSKGNSKLMADTKQVTDSQSDLSNIEVPKLELPKLVEMPVSTKSNSYVDKLESPSAQNSVLNQNSMLNQKYDDMDSSLIPNGSLSLTLDPPSNNKLKSWPEPHATASLESPVVKPQEPLFKDNDLTQAKPNISAQPASTPTQQSATNGEMPSVWDSSKANLHDTSKALTLEFSSDDSRSVFNPITPPSQPSNEYPTATTKLISQSTAVTPNNIVTSTAAALAPKDLQNAVKTVTPEMDQAELFAAYRELKAPAAPAKIDNRYGTTIAASTQSQPGAATGTPAPAVGYTQQPGTQPNVQSALSGNNYTLQPAQNYSPNSAMQQYSASQNQYSASQNPHAVPQNLSQQIPTQQYQNHQYQNPQYPNSLNSGRPYSGQQNQVLPQYAAQSKSGLQNANSSQIQGASSQGSIPQGSIPQGLQYGGAQVPYNSQPSQASPVQLPPGPIGGYGYSPSQMGNQIGTQFGTAGSMPTNMANGGTANVAIPHSPSYPSLR